jgi:hypothetical protein
MIQTGVGPGQIPLRDPATGDIPGAPVIFSRILGDELAQLTKNQVPSGFLNPKPFVNSPQPFKVTLDTSSEVIVDGYRIPLGPPGSTLDIQLSGSPNSGTRDDLIFLEFWFDFAAAQAKTLKWRVRSVADINFTAHPNGLTDPRVTAFDSIGADTYIPYQKVNPNFQNRAKDAGLYLAAKLNQNQNALTELGSDDNSYVLTYAIPVARVRRINSGIYHPVTNPDGGPSSILGVSPRPDGLFNDNINVQYQVVDLRNKVSFVLNFEELLQKSIVDLLKNRLTAQGLVSEVVAKLNDNNQQTYFGDTNFVDKFVTVTNLIRYSHFRTQDSVSSNLALGWSLYQTGTVTGTSLFGNPGQVIQRTADVPQEAYGVQQTVAGFTTKTYWLQFGYILAWTNPGAELIIEGVRSDNSLVFQKTISLTNVPAGLEQHIEQYFENTVLDTSVTLRAYLKSSGARVTLTYVDLKTSKYKKDIMEVTDGTVYQVKLDPYLSNKNVTFSESQTLVFDPLAGAALTGTYSLVAPDLLQVQLISSTTARDLRIVSTLNYSESFGFTPLFKQPDKAWDNEGFVSLINVANPSHTLTTHQLGLLNLANENVVVFNPETSFKGTTVLITFSGNGTGTYTLPATKYGRKVLLPLSVTLNGSSQILASLHKNNDGTFTFTLGNSITVNTSTTFTVEVALEAPIIAWSEPINGIKSVYSTKYISAVASGTSSSVTIPASGLVKGSLQSSACLPVFVNNESVLVTQGATIIADNKPFITVDLPIVPSAGDIVEIAVLVKEAVEKDSNLSVAYKSIPAANNLDVAAAAPSYKFLTKPVMLAHTKGTGAADLNSDFGPEPFVQNTSLDCQPIALVGKAPLRSTVLDIPLAANSFLNEPIYLGRQVMGSPVAGTFTGVVEGDPLHAAVNHETLLAALIHVGGRICLWLARSYRTDAKNLIDSSAVIQVLDLNQRPLTLL